MLFDDSCMLVMRLSSVFLKISISIVDIVLMLDSSRLICLLVVLLIMMSVVVMNIMSLMSCIVFFSDRCGWLCWDVWCVCLSVDSVVLMVIVMRNMISVNSILLMICVVRFGMLGIVLSLSLIMMNGMMWFSYLKVLNLNNVLLMCVVDSCVSCVIM